MRRFAADESEVAYELAEELSDSVDLVDETITSWSNFHGELLNFHGHSDC